MPRRLDSTRRHLHVASSAFSGPVGTGLLSLFTAASLSTIAPPARAVDGCLVLLCFAAPNWRAIPQCVPPIRQVLRDLARGRAFPRCAMAGAGNAASHFWTSAPEACPPQYTRVHETEGGWVYTCLYDGLVTVEIDGALWSHTWWNTDGETVTVFSRAARARLGAWDAGVDPAPVDQVAQQPAPAQP